MSNSTKTAAFLVSIVAIIGCLLHRHLAAGPLQGAGAASGGESIKQGDVSSADPMADLVADFYRAVMQNDAPSGEQEAKLFPKKTSASVQLLARPKHGPEKTIVLEYFRAHKQWFIPPGVSPSDDIWISNRVVYLRSVKSLRPKARNDDGDIIVTMIVTDPVTKLSVKHAIVFPIRGGKIDPDNITLNGFSEPVYDHLFSPKEGAVISE